MTNLENRVFRLEVELRAVHQAIRDLQVLVGKLKQDQFAGGLGFGGGGGGNNPLFCVLSGALAASGAIPAGSPTHITGQTVYKIASGAFSSVSSAADVYNGLPNAISSGAKVIVMLNADGTYSVIAVAC